MAFAAKDHGQISEKGACKICGRLGYEETVCYEVIGYPPGWGTRGRGWGNRGGRSSRTSCGGHRAAGSGSFLEVASAALHTELMNDPSTRTGPGPAIETSAAAHSATQPNIPGLTTDQVKRLLNLIDVPRLKYEKLSGKVSWMLDNRVSCHMVGNKTMLNDVRKIAPILIGFPNGAHTVASEMGITSLGENLPLENVL